MKGTPDRKSIPPIQTSGGPVVEYGAWHTFGVKSLMVNEEMIALETRLPNRYVWRRSEVESVIFERPRWNPWRYYTVRLVSGEEPDVYFNLLFGTRALVERFEQLGWPVKVEPPLLRLRS